MNCTRPSVWPTLASKLSGSRPRFGCTGNRLGVREPARAGLPGPGLAEGARAGEGGFPAAGELTPAGGTGGADGDGPLSPTEPADPCEGPPPPGPGEAAGPSSATGTGGAVARVAGSTPSGGNRSAGSLNVALLEPE